MAVLLKKTPGLRISIPAAIIALMVLAGCSNSGGPDPGRSVVGTLAGSAKQGYADGTGTEVQFNWPFGVAVDSKDNVYVADTGNHRIRKISPAGVVSTLAGSGEEGYADGAGTEAQFYYPADVAVDRKGNIYVATGNHRIRKITPAGVVTTLAGTGDEGYADGAGTEAQFGSLNGVTVDGRGNVYVADLDNHRIRKITPAGVVTTLAGNGDEGYADGTGTEAQFNQPFGVAVDGKGNVYVADTGNHRIRKISPAGVVSTLAGSGDRGYTDGAGTEAQFYSPIGVAVDRKGNVYVTDVGNRIRTITREKGGPGRNEGPGGKGGLIGTWESDDLYITMTWTFTGNKLTQEVMGVKITSPYTIKGNAIAMEYEGVEVEFEYKIEGNTLTIDMYGDGVEFERVTK
jgi:sugar lactone lactonase YvrE